MLSALLVLVGLAVPALAFAFPADSTARSVLATGIFWWTLPSIGLAWLAWVNYSLYTRVDGRVVRLFTLRGRRALDLDDLDRIRSLSMWGQFGGTHTLRLHTRDGNHAMVVASMPLAGLNRGNLSREQQLRAALAQHADLADARGRWWLGAGPRPSRWASARHLAAMLALYVVVIVVTLVALVSYLVVALD